MVYAHPVKSYSVRSNPSKKKEPCLSREDVLDRIGISKSCLSKWIKEGIFPSSDLHTGSMNKTYWKISTVSNWEKSIQGKETLAALTKRKEVK
jgi:predicted DNA-binding transcriptional regulator AlpA